MSPENPPLPFKIPPQDNEGSPFEAGDTVTLKSGGMVMTVEYSAMKPHGVRKPTLCVWFSAGGEMKSNWFGGDALRKVEVPDAPFAEPNVKTQTPNSN